MLTIGNSGSCRIYTKISEIEQKIFFDGQIYDAFSLITSIIQKAKKEIILIDGYVDAENFNAQYPTLSVTKTQVFHDRFIILDGKTAYPVGAGKRSDLTCGRIMRIIRNQVV